MKGRLHFKDEKILFAISLRDKAKLNEVGNM